MKKNVIGLTILSLLMIVFIANLLKEDKVILTSSTASPSDVSSMSVVKEEETLAVNTDVTYAKDFTLSNLQGEQVRLSDYKGQIVILNFWTTWCAPCKEEMPHMQNFYEQHDDVEILAVNLTSMDIGLDRVKQFADEYALTFPILLDEEDRVGQQYEIITIPTSYIIDQDGKVAQQIVGPMDEALMEEHISTLKSMR